MSNVIQHPKAAQSLHCVRFLHPAEMSDELTARLVVKMEALAREAYLDGRRHGFREGWLNGATMMLALALLAFAFVLTNAKGRATLRGPQHFVVLQSATGVDMRVPSGTGAVTGLAGGVAAATTGAAAGFFPGFAAAAGTMTGVAAGAGVDAAVTAGAATGAAATASGSAIVTSFG